MPVVPYKRQISEQTANVPDAPSIPRLDLSGGLSAINRVGQANENLGEAVAKVGEALYKHQQEQQKLKNEQIGAQVYTQYARDVQDKLLNDQIETVKINGQDITRPVGIMNRQLSQADGAYQELDNWYFGQAKNKYLSQIPDKNTRAKIAMMMDSHYDSTRGTVMSHQASQTRKDLVNTFQSSIKQQVSDAYGLSNPAALNAAIDNATLTQHDLNTSMGLDPETSKLAFQNTNAAVVENAVMGKLKGTGNVLEAKALLDSVKDKLSEKDYADIQNNIKSSAETIRQQVEHEALVAKVENRFQMVNDIATGKLKWDNSGAKIKQVALVDKELAEAMQKVISSDGKFQPESQVNDEYQNMVGKVFSASTNEELSKFLIDAMNSAGNGKISRDRLAILVNAAQQRAKALPPTDAKGVPLPPTQIAIDGGAQAILRWNKQHGENNPETLDNYLTAIHAGKTPMEAYQGATKATIIKKHPEISTHEDVPNVIVSENSPIKYVYTGNTNIYPARIWNPTKKVFEVNLNRAKGTKPEAKK